MANLWDQDPVVGKEKSPWDQDAVVTTPGGYGAGTVAKDVGKLIGAGAVKGIAGAPETVQAVGSETARNTLFAPTEALNLIADPRRLANKLVGAVGLPPVFEVTKDKPLVPANVTEKQKTAVNETLAKGKIPQLRQLTEYGNKLSEDIENTISPEMRLAMAESQPTGNIVKALETGDFSELSMGKNPTALGLTGQAVKVFGSSAPALLVAMVTKSAGPATAVGFGQAGAEGIDEARNYVKSMSDEELTKKSEYFRNLVTLGYSPKEARLMTEDKAADTAALYQGSVGALGSAFTTKLIQGSFDKALLGNVKSRLGKIVQGTAIAGAEGALTEAAEGIATDLGIDKTIVREIGVDSFANLVLGAIGEAAPGVIRGAVAPGEPVKGAEAPESKATPTGFEADPVVVEAPAAAPSAIITDEELEAEEGLTPVSPPPPTPPAEPEAVAPAAPAATPAAPVAATAEIAQRIDELDAEFKAIDAAYGTATPDQIGPMSARQGEIKSEIAKLFQAGTTGAPVEITSAATEAPAPKKPLLPEKKPNDPAVEAEAIALSEELKKLGDNASGDGLRNNLERQGGFTNTDKLKYYQDKLVEAQQKVGKAPEMPQETFTTRNFIGDYKADKARFEKFLPVAPQPVQDMIAKSDQYLQALTDKINAAGYKVIDINPTAPKELRELKTKISQIGGSTFRYFKEADHIAKNNRFANPDKLAKTAKTLEQDFAEVDQMLGVEAAKPKAAEVVQEPVQVEEPVKELNEAEKKSSDVFKKILADNPNLEKRYKESHEEDMLDPSSNHEVEEYPNSKNLKIGDLVYEKGDPLPKYVLNIGSNDSVKLIDSDGKSFAGWKQIDEIDNKPIDYDYKFDFGFGPVNVNVSKWLRNDDEWQFDMYGPGASETGYRSVLGIKFDSKPGTKKFNEFVERVAKANALTKPIKAKKPTKEEKVAANKARQSEKKAKTEKAAEVRPKIEEIVSPEVASAMKDIEFQKKLIKANNEKLLTETEFNKVYNLHQSGKTAQADVQLTKILEKKENKAKAKEEHIEGNTSEPVTSKTIEEAIDKAEVTVDSNKIKTAIKNQFEQAIKRAKIQTELEWERAKGLLPAEKFVTISVPGDGQFKVKNNVERLKELQTKMVNATTLKGPAVKGAPSSGSIEAFKGMVDDKDMENAIEYAKLKGLDPKTVKLNPTQRTTVDNYLKNPAEFERQKEESEQMAEARQTALRRDQEKRIAERLEADEKREEEARFKAVLDTTIRSTQPQLKGDIAKRKITSADAARMLEVISGLPTGTVKPYVTKELEKIAAPKAGFVTDDEGEKIDFPLIVDMANKGYKVLGFDNPRTYADKAGNTFRTIEKDGVRLAIDARKVLFKQQGKEYGRVQYGIGKEKDVTFEHLAVDPSKRKKGLAKQAIQDLVDVADKNGYTLYLEPAQLEDQGMTKEQLSALYSKYGFVATNESGSPMERIPKLADESRTIDVEATEISEKEIKLLADQTGKLTSAEIQTLKKHYKTDLRSDNFYKLLREDIITYTNKGADAIDKAIRSIIAKLQAAVLAVAIVFNPAYMSEPSAVVFPSKPGVEQVKADIPESAKDMSDGAKKAYATLYPALQEGLQSKDKLFTIVDKPTSKMYVFNPDGSLLVKDNVLLGKALGDTYVGQTQFKENRMTPAGLIKVKAEKGSDLYDGKTIYTFGNVKEDWRAAFIHTVYLKESDAEARKKALETGKDTRMSYGCINAKPELMAKIAENNRMDESHVFVVPDNQEMVDDYIANTVPNEDLTRETVAPVTRTTQVPEKPSAPKVVAREEKAVEQKTQAEINRDRQLKRLAQREKPLDKPYYNDFTSNINSTEFVRRIQDDREETIKEYAQTRAASRRALKKIAKYGSDIPMQRELNGLLEKEEVIKSVLDANKPIRNSAAEFMAKATEEMAAKNLAPEVEAVIRQVYEKYPGILEGLRLSTRARKAGGKDAGNFNPYTRLVTLWKDGSGVENPATIRHELTHSLEQMMTPEARKAVVEAWARSFENAIKRNTDKKSQEFFNKVFDFLDNPSKESFDAATKVMPSYDFYQYMNPSEYWAVNAEKLMEAKLGTPWARFVSAVKKLLEALKSVFGVNNTFAVHKEFDNIINGKLERTKDKEMLLDYLLQGKVKLDFLNNIEDVNELLEKHSRPDAPRKPSLSVRDAFMGGYDNTKETVKDVLTSPLIATNNMIGQADRALTKFRNKNIFFGYGLEEADRQRYGGQVRNAHQQAIASVAVVNALHSGNIATQVMTLGKLEFDPNIQMFIAAKSDKSMANVVREKAKLIDKLGFDTGNRVIQAYFEAKRSRSIVNEYLNREAAYVTAIEEGQNEEEARKDLANIEAAVQKVNMNDEAMDDFIDLENKYPELRKMMDNWTAVNGNMIDMMEFSGIISKQRAKSLRSIKDYVPWYRIMDDQEDIHSAPKNTRGLTNVASDKKFGPGKTERDIDDIVDNMIHNVLTITRNSARNYAANRVVMEYGERYKEGKNAGKLRVFPKDGSDADGVRFNIIANGRRIVVRIQDPLVAEAVIGMENIDIPMNGALAFMANTLRRSITTFPAFQVAQLFMDAPTASLVTGLKRPDKVWAGVFTSFLKNLRKDDPIVAKLRAAGIGGYQSSARTPEKEIQLDIGLIQGSWFSKAMKGLDRFGDASDYAQRRSVYIQTMKETGDEMLALFQANNVIDFKKRGSGKLAQLVTRQVAFMNAYAQSIDVLAKGLSGTGLKGIDRKKALARMATAGMLLASATIVYCMLVGDDEEYNKLDDQTKMRTIFIPELDIRLPMHSGAAFFFKAIPELIYNAITKEGTKDEYDRKRLIRALGKAAADSLLGPNVTPTGVKPFVEIALNRNFFTGGQVTPKGMEDLAAFRQYNQNTSELGKIISSLTGTEKSRLLNPIEADHLVRGLTGTIGAAVMWGTNLLAGDRVAPQAKDNPFYGQFIMPDVPRGREDLYYDLKSKTDEAYKTYMDLQKKGRKDEAADWFKENKKLIQVYGYTSSIEADLKRINGEIRRMSDLPGDKMSPDAKRKRLTELQELKGRILKDVISMRKRAGFDD